MLIDLKENIDRSVSAFHTIENVKKMLLEHEFTELLMDEKFNLTAGGKYFVNLYDSTMAAFVVKAPDNKKNKPELRIACSHTDFPTFKIKPECEIRTGITSKKGYLKINTEVYGGPILNTWLDRPLSIAGRVAVRGKDCFLPELILVDFKEPVLTIPNLAIHMNRNVNKGVELNRQKDMLPIADVIENINENLNHSNFNDHLLENINKQIHNNQALREKLGKECLEYDDILDYELFLYQCEMGCQIGFVKTLFSSPRLDNLTSVYGITAGLIESCKEKIQNKEDMELNQCGVHIAMYFDNEEIGSKTKQGAASNVLPMLLEKIYLSLGKSREDMINNIFRGFMLSVDVAHATHPNAVEKSDITNPVMLNSGIVIKESANQAYAGDTFAVSVIKQLCLEHDIKYQVFVNRSDMIGGQTLGSILSVMVPMRTLDIGIPVLAMHSARELMGVEDQKKLEKLLTVFFS